MPKPTITYFDIRARAEPIRLILEELSVDYEDRRVRAEDWPELKPKTPFGRLPSYCEADLEIWQSHAIFRHIARVHDLYGSTESDRVRCDVVEEAFADLNNLVGRAPWRPEFDETRNDFIANELSPALAQLECFLQTNETGTSFWVGSSLTFVDLIAFAHLDCTRAMFPEATVQHPLLQEFCTGIAKRPRIAAYLRSSRRPPAIQYGPKGKIYETPSL